MQAYGKVTWDVAAASPITADDVAMAAPVAEAELAVGFFGSRYDRATPAEREYMHAMAELGGPQGTAVATSEVAVSLGRKPASLSPARDSLIKKGLVYSAERGPDRLHRAALRPLPAQPPGLAVVPSCGWERGPLGAAAAAARSSSGALVAWFVRRAAAAVVASVMAFGSGVLISAVAFDLVEEAADIGGLPATAAGFLGGAVVYLAANPALARRGARHRKRSGGQQPSEDEQSGSGAAIAVGRAARRHPRVGRARARAGRRRRGEPARSWPPCSSPTCPRACPAPRA